MFIIWGRKLVRRKVGFVADFCPICRDLATFELQRVGSAGHIYYISAGEGALVGFERRCTRCSTTLNAEPTTYSSVADQIWPLPELISLTYPALREALKDRLDLEEQIQHDPSALSPEDRHALIRNPFLLLSPKVEQRYSSTSLDLEIGLSLVASLILVPTGMWGILAVAPDLDGPAFVFLILVSLVLVGWQVALSGRRFMRRQVIPVLAKTLAPLKPIHSELEAVLSELRQFKHRIGSKLRLDDLEAHLNIAVSAEPRLSPFSVRAEP